ncbi:nitroreductase [Thiolinea disciformis]|uniref:nitroreductase n=1 Tax=Thiolinea disciformis TaxID=125614 RepID=UPI00036DA5A6|nr:nitroreductase [Thiolinea disciformis]
MQIDPKLATPQADAVMAARHSVRAYLPKTVDKTLVDELLSISARAPSGTNTQPWFVHVLTGNTLNQLVERVCAAFDAQDTSHQPEYDYYPVKFFDPYLARRRKIGWDMYSLLGIGKGDMDKTRAQHRKNFEFFGAPVGLIFTIDRRMGKGSWLDYGMFLQNIMLAAVARGLDTCPQAAWIDYHTIISEVLQLDEHQQVVCGMALGYADNEATVNKLVTERAPTSEFVSYHS